MELIWVVDSPATLAAAHRDTRPFLLVLPDAATSLVDVRNAARHKRATVVVLPPSHRDAADTLQSLCSGVRSPFRDGALDAPVVTVLCDAGDRPLREATLGSVCVLVAASHHHTLQRIQAALFHGLQPLVVRLPAGPPRHLLVDEDELQQLWEQPQPLCLVQRHATCNATALHHTTPHGGTRGVTELLYGDIRGAPRLALPWRHVRV